MGPAPAPPLGPPPLRPAKGRRNTWGAVRRGVLHLAEDLGAPQGGSIWGWWRPDPQPPDPTGPPCIAHCTLHGVWGPGVAKTCAPGAPEGRVRRGLAAVCRGAAGLSHSGAGSPTSAPPPRAPKNWAPRGRAATGVVVVTGRRPGWLSDFSEPPNPTPIPALAATVQMLEAFAPPPLGARPGASSLRTFLAVAVEDLALAGIAEHVVGLGDLLELLLRARLLVLVRVVAQRLAPVRALDLLVRRAAGQAQRLVVVFPHRAPPPAAPRAPVSSRPRPVPSPPPPAPGLYIPARRKLPDPASPLQNLPPRPGAAPANHRLPSP